MATEPWTLADEIALRLRERRLALGWSQAKLASEMAGLGFPWTRMTVTDIEGRRQRTVSKEELLGVAFVLDAPVTSLIGASIRVAPGSDGPRSLQLSDSWALPREDVWRLIHSGRPDRVQRLQARIDELLAEEEETGSLAKSYAARVAELAGERQRLERQIQSEEPSRGERPKRGGQKRP